MSFVRYNGVTILYAQTRVHQMGPVMDPSGSDELYIKIRLEAEGLVVYDKQLLPHPNSAAGDDPSSEGVLKYIRHLLCQPRQQLFYDTEAPGFGPVTGNALISQLPLSRDDANGPFPDPAAIEVTYTAPGSFLVKFAVETYIRDCGPRYANKPLSIRWEESIDFKENFQAVVTRTGYAVISSLSTISIDTIRRSWVTPACPRGFARTRASYSMSPDGLRCDFTFVDEQLRYAPPAPATDMQIVQSEETNPTGIGQRQGMISVRVVGAVTADPLQLQEIAAQVAVERLYAARPFRAPGGLVLGATKFATTETRDAVEVVLIRTYKTRIRSTLVVPPAGLSTGRLLRPPVTFAGRYIPADYGWVGYGTTFRTGYGEWASPDENVPSGVVVPPSDGLGLAQAVGFYAALLRDPCGSAMPATPYAAASTPTGGAVASSPSPAGGIFSTLVSVAPGGGTTASSSYWGSRFAPGGSTSGAVTDILSDTGAGGSTGESPAAMRADATAPPTTPANLVTAILTYGLTTAARASGLTETANPTTAEDLAPGVYSRWQCYNEFYTDQGNVVVPVCNPEAPSVQIKHSGDVLVFRKRWTACKIGSPPALPAKEQGRNLVLVSEFVGLPNITTTPNGTDTEYQIEGVYEYRALDPTVVETLADSPPYLAPTWTLKNYDWADTLTERLLSDDGKTVVYDGSVTEFQAPAGAYDYPNGQYTNSTGTGNVAGEGVLVGTPPQPGGSVASGGVVKGGTSTGAGTIFSIGVGVPGAAGGRSAPNPGTPLFGGASTSSAAPFAASGGTAVVPAPPPQPEPDGGN